MKTYRKALYDAHEAMLDDIENKMAYKDAEYILGMLDAARIVLTMLTNELNKKEEDQND